jgi:ATP-dependent helicase Lhr and Lhr-like helicase
MKSEECRRVAGWFASRGRTPFEFQERAWRAYLAGKSGLIHAPTGMGKTLAAALGPVMEWMRGESEEGSRNKAALKLLWITPLRALASDTLQSLSDMALGLELPWGVDLRTSDTKQAARRRQAVRLPTVLITTPESMSLMLSYPDAGKRLGSLDCVVVDEWHELMGTKRGVQTELCLAHLRAIRPGLRTWGLSATIGNLHEAVATLLGPERAKSGEIISAPDEKTIDVLTLLPETIERFPWAGHLGTRMLEAVAKQVEAARTTLIFTNTRSQAEIWFAQLLAARPDWLGKLAVHHGSLDRALRHRVEDMLRKGDLRAVVCTSSLDLGVDFWPVEQVIQISSPKGVARAMQRAGRSGHQPGQRSRIVFSPTQAFELIEFSATRVAIAGRVMEARKPPVMSLDVLAQHVVTLASGDGFVEEELFQEVNSTHAFAGISREQWSWVMDFVRRGGPTLRAYPRFVRVVEREGRNYIASDQLAKQHRMGVGTIASDGAVMVKFVGGKFLGTVEESFAGKLRAGDRFAFAGRVLEFVRLHEMTVQVRKARQKSALVPRWGGSLLPMSASLAAAVRRRLDDAAGGVFDDEEMRKVQPILELQQRWSRIPRHDELLIESTRHREGRHCFLYPFQGRLAHEGLAALLMYRLRRKADTPISATFNDYGLELMSPRVLVESEAEWRELLSLERLMEDVLECVNSMELSRRHFREIARIAGLLMPARPGAPTSVRQLQASSELFYDVFREFDPGNLLLEQSRREVLEKQLEITRLKDGLEQIAGQKLVLLSPAKISPMAFPLWAEEIASQKLRSETARERIERVARELEAAADKGLERVE